MANGGANSGPTDAAAGPITVRRPEPRDYARMAALSGELGYPSNERDLAARLAALGDERNYAVFVAESTDGEDAARVAGWIGVYLFRAVEVATFAEISGLVVGAEVRSRGVGRRLVAAAEAWARERGCEVLSVRCNVIRERAHGFYAANGFEHVKTQKTFRKRL